MKARGWCILGFFLAAQGIALAQKPSFEVASVRESKAAGPSSMNFPLNPGPQYNAKGGLLTARNVPLLQLLVFAYTKNMYQITLLRQALPEWAKQTRWDVSARADGNPTKDEMRAMMRTLLEDRFALMTHAEMRQVPVFQLVQARPGKLGPRLTPFTEAEPPCAAEAPPWGRQAGEPAPPTASVMGGLPAWCGTVVMLPGEATGQIKVGGRRLSMAEVALSVGGFGEVVDRPVVDGTRLPGLFDLMLEFAPDNSDPARAGSEMPLGPSLAGALKDQLGLKLESGRATVEVVVLDHVEKPGEN